MSTKKIVRRHDPQKPSKTQNPRSPATPRPSKAQQHPETQKPSKTQTLRSPAKPKPSEAQQNCHGSFARGRSRSVWRRRERENRLRALISQRRARNLTVEGTERAATRNVRQGGLSLSLTHTLSLYLSLTLSLSLSHTHTHSLARSLSLFFSPSLSVSFRSLARSLSLFVSLGKRGPVDGNGGLVGARMGRELMALKNDRTTRIPSGVASPATTDLAAKGSVFVNFRNTSNLEIWKKRTG